jgi:cephalosporin hydroxylase
MQEMKLTLDTSVNSLVIEENGKSESLSLYSTEGFETLSKVWLKVGWNQKYSYSFTWFGRPIIQLPEDLIRIQEVIFRVKPDVIVETGVAHGGSLIYYASLCKAMDSGRVVGVDLEIRPHNREAIERHELSKYITLLEGDSVSKAVVDEVVKCLRPDDNVLVVLDSAHSKDHVLKELELYAPLVTEGSYIVATDGIMRHLWDVPSGNKNWLHDNPTEAAAQYALGHPEFVVEQPAWQFNESALSQNVTYWPGAYLLRRGSRARL